MPLKLMISFGINLEDMKSLKGKMIPILLKETMQSCGITWLALPEDLAASIVVRMRRNVH